MKSNASIVSLLVVIGCPHLSAVHAEMGTAFTYQGVLPVVYAELRRLADSWMAKLPPTLYSLPLAKVTPPPSTVLQVSLYSPPV